ncbi:MAG: transketolase [Halanaerobiales bacterium]
MLKKIANVVRGLSADGVEAAGSGHPGMPIGCADIGAVLFGDIMKYDPEKPDWPDKDRFVLSAGHGSMFLYSYLHLAGYDLPLEELKDFRQLHSETPGHPEHGETEGVETTTGPLGQGFANAVGMALAEKIMAEKYNTGENKIVDHHTYTILGDGCMMEGLVSEAASLAGHLGLNKLVAIYDDNEISIAGKTDLTFTESVAERFKAFDWNVIEDVDGHDIDEVKKAIEKAKEQTDKPTLIMARTHIAFGAPGKQDSSSAHGAPLGEEEIRGMKKYFDLPEDEKFYVPEEVREYFKNRTQKLRKERKNWEKEFEKWSTDNPQLRQDWDQAYNLELPDNLRGIVDEIDIETPIATRKASGATLRKIADEVPYLIGGSADLAPSTKTYLDKYNEIQNGKYDGRNLRYGVREHAMGAISNGLSLHKGVRPFAATFLVFSDYMRPAIRMAALMNQPIVYVFTHDSIAIGEDGPTHQPVEHVESLRLIPNLKVIRPGDEEETKAAWITAMERTEGPTALIFTRQNLPHLDKVNGIDGFYKGGYVIKESGETPEVVLMASGSETSLAVDIADLLEKENKKVRVISIPDREEFVKNHTELDKLLGNADTLRVALEAGVGQGWYQLLKSEDMLISIDTFGASGPGEEVYEEFGFKAETISKDILDKL